jgi:hypothetical protein
MCSALDNIELNGLLPDFSKIPNLVTLYVTFMTITFVTFVQLYMEISNNFNYWKHIFNIDHKPI